MPGHYFKLETIMKCECDHWECEEAAQVVKLEEGDSVVNVLPTKWKVDPTTNSISRITHTGDL